MIRKKKSDDGSKGGEEEIIFMEMKRMVDVEELQPVLDSSGKEVELGSGTYSTVFLRKFQGHFVAEKVFKYQPKGE